MSELISSKQITCTGDRATELSNVLHCYDVDENGVAKTTNGVKDIAVDFKDDALCKALVEKFAERYSEGMAKQEVSGYAKVLASILKSQTEAHQLFVSTRLKKKVSKEEIDKQYQGSYLQKYGMLPNDKILEKSLTKSEKTMQDIEDMPEDDQVSAMAKLLANPANRAKLVATNPALAKELGLVK